MMYVTINAHGQLCLEAEFMAGYISLCGLHGSVWCPGWLPDPEPHPEDPPF